MAKSDITILTIQCADAASQLYTRLATGAGDPQQSYNIFIDLFYRLYMMFRPNAELTGKITDWQDKVKMFDSLFARIKASDFQAVKTNNDGTKEIVHTNFIPDMAIGYWQIMLKDLVSVGVYNLTATDFVEREQ